LTERSFLLLTIGEPEFKEKRSVGGQRIVVDIESWREIEYQTRLEFNSCDMCPHRTSPRLVAPPGFVVNISHNALHKHDANKTMVLLVGTCDFH
jgi:hypothetical protein